MPTVKLFNCFLGDYAFPNSKYACQASGRKEIGEYADKFLEISSLFLE